MLNSDLIWQTGVVRHGPEGRQVLEFADPGACTRCSQGTGCGAALFSRLFAKPVTRLSLEDGIARPAGRLIRVGMDPRWLLLAAAANYLLPVVAFVAGAVLADMGWPRSDSAALVAGIVSMVSAWFLARLGLSSVYRPRLRLVDFDGALESSDQRDHISPPGS